MLTYLALGDSYTIGESVPFESNFPNQLVTLLNNTSKFSFAQPKIVAVTGWTTTELTTSIAKEEPIAVADITTLLIGVNNQYRGLDLGLFEREFTALLLYAIEHTNNGAQNVFVLSIPDWGVTPFASERDTNLIAQEIAKYNSIKKAIAAKYNCHFIDITPSTIEHGNNPEYLVEDLLHYSAKEYKIWAQKTHKVLLENAIL